MSGEGIPEDCLGRIAQDCDRVAEKLASTYESAIGATQTLVKQLQKTQRRLARAHPPTLLGRLCSQVLEQRPNTALSKDFKELHSQVVKLGKTIDRNLEKGVGDLGAHSGGAHALSERVVLRAAVHSLLRRGRFEVAARVIADQKLDRFPSEVHFRELDACRRALACGDPSRCLRWADNEADRRMQHGLPPLRDLHDLRFDLLQLRYLQLLSAGGKACLRAIEFARSRFSDYARERQRDIQRLAGALLFAKNIAASPYRDLRSEQTLARVARRFEVVFCRAKGFAGVDPLAVAVMASDMAMPKRLKYESVLRSGAQFLEEKDMAPLEIDLGRHLQFHSTFVCPVSKQQASPANPPVLLCCGHVISKEAMEAIAQTRRGGSVKCPTCPAETHRSKCLVLKI